MAITGRRKRFFMIFFQRRYEVDLILKRIKLVSFDFKKRISEENAFQSFELLFYNDKKIYNSPLITYFRTIERILLFATGSFQLLFFVFSAIEFHPGHKSQKSSNERGSCSCYSTSHCDHCALRYKLTNLRNLSYFQKILAREFL